MSKGGASCSVTSGVNPWVVRFKRVGDSGSYNADGETWTMRAIDCPMEKTRAVEQGRSSIEKQGNPQMEEEQSPADSKISLKREYRSPWDNKGGNQARLERSSRLTISITRPSSFGLIDRWEDQSSKPWIHRGKILNSEPEGPKPEHVPHEQRSRRATTRCKPRPKEISARE